MATVKLSISLPEEDVALLDRLSVEAGFASRSAVIQHALARLRAADLQGDYADAWDEWSAEGDDAPWDAASADGTGTGTGTGARTGPGTASANAGAGGERPQGGR